MRLKRRNHEHRVRRMRLRASSQRPPARMEAPVRAIFASPPPPLPQSESDSRRRSPRRSLGIEISVRKVGGFSFQLPAFDVSAGGCRVELVEMVDVGERVIVRLPTLEPLAAEVAWLEGNHAGLLFERPLHIAVFDQLMDRFGPCAA